MFDDDNSSGLSLTTGAKVAILVAIPFVLFGLYLLFAPISDLRTTSGAVFNCGSPINPASDKWHANICGDLPSNYLYQGIASVATGLLLAGLGYFFFGSRDETQQSVALSSGPPAATTPAEDAFADEAPARTIKKARTRTFD